MDLIRKIENYLPFNCAEEKDKEIMIKYINTFDDVLTRNNEIGHFTSSCWIVNKDKTKVLMIYHNIYD
ncbi:NUDIX hydrolase, partial [Clostridioides difficile]|nr:NUDIX hydrolase [Clostridioides difficile]